jgi:hypothetical protein
MSVIRVGSTSTYADGWEAVFGGKATKKATAPKSAAGRTATKKSAKKKPVAQKKKAKTRRRR